MAEIKLLLDLNWHGTGAAFEVRLRHHLCLHPGGAMPLGLLTNGSGADDRKGYDSLLRLTTST